MNRFEPPAATDLDLLCPRCGCRVPPAGERRHDAWHEFLESGIAELVAAVAALESRGTETG